MFQNLSIRFRQWGKDANPKAFVDFMQQQLGAYYKLVFILGTLPGDPAVDLAKAAGVQHVIETDVKKFNEPVNALTRKAAELNMPSLFISPGMQITAWHVQRAAHLCAQLQAISYSWQIQGQGNDGTAPGKYGYFTCWYDTIEALQTAPEVPAYVNDGVLPDLVVIDDGKKITSPTGGGEDGDMIAARVQRYLETGAFFRHIHDASNIVGMTAKTGTNVAFSVKIWRKFYVMTVYLALRGLTRQQYERHIIVV